MNKVSNHLSLFTIREYLIFEVASLKMLSIVSDSLSPNTYVCVRFTLLVVFVVVTVCGLDRFGRGWLL